MRLKLTGIVHVFVSIDAEPEGVAAPRRRRPTAGHHGLTSCHPAGGPSRLFDFAGHAPAARSPGRDFRPPLSGHRAPDGFAARLSRLGAAHAGAGADRIDRREPLAEAIRTRWEGGRCH